MDPRRRAPAAQRNREPILEVLARVLPPLGLVLEVASGSGEHVAHLATALPALAFQPSDPDAAARASIAAWCADLVNVAAPLDLDVTRTPWPVERADAVVCINMLHIAPWAAGEALLAGAARVLPPGGILYLYGPYRIGGAHTAPSNEAFDRSLRAENAAWGVRDLEQVIACAAPLGLDFALRVPMPANNQSVVLRRAT